MIYHLLKKELHSIFSTPLAYILVSLYSLISGVMFFNLLVTYSDGIQVVNPEMLKGISFVDEVVLRLFANMNFLLLLFIPLITMRSFSEEYKNQTINLYWLSPVKEWELLLAKQLAALIVILSFMAMTLIYPMVIWGVGINDLSLLVQCYFAILLNSLAYISIGVFFSSLTENQVVSAILTILSIMLLWMISWGAHLSSNYYLSELMAYLGITVHFERLLRGTINSQDLVYYVSVIFIFSFLSLKKLGMRKFI